MNLGERADPVPLRADADGVIRIGETRVTLDTLVAAFEHGATAEEIVHQYSSVTLADAYLVIAFYLRPLSEVGDYLGQRQTQAADVRRATSDVLIRPVCAIVSWREGRYGVGLDAKSLGDHCWSSPLPVGYAVRRVNAMTELERRRADILRIADEHGASNVRVVGSEARDEARSDSDLDLLVDMASDRSLLDLVGLGQDLEDLLGRRVDVLTAASVHPRLRATILADARPL